MLVIVSVDEIYNAMPVEVETKTTCKITLSGGKGIGESSGAGSRPVGRTETVKLRGSSFFFYGPAGAT